jgi:hypothetical protein
MRGGDSDGDGIPDYDECPTGYPCADDDGDGMANYLDQQAPIQPAVTENPKDDIVHFSFIPRALHIPVDAPKFREAFRVVVGNRLTDILLSDERGADAKVDLVSLVALIGATSAFTFTTLYTILKIAGLLVFII